jgi:hypothetical protein
MTRAIRIFLASFVVLFATSGVAHAAGGNYGFDGGTAAERAQVRAALNVSSFNWSVVPARIVVHIARGIDSEATQGNIWLDSDLLDGGSFAWGVVQHEYAHQVDFFLLDDAKRAALGPKLGGNSWWQVAGPSLPHGSLTSERFASTLAWTFWHSSENCMKPSQPNDESAATSPAKFKALVTQVIGTAAFAARH